MSQLPLRPWWRHDVPLVWRSDDAIYVGDGDRRVLITDVTRELVTWLVGLQGDRTLNEALDEAQALGLGRRHPRRLLRLSVRTGALDDAALASDLLADAEPTLRDRLTRELAAARATHGSPKDTAAAFERRIRARVAVSGSGPVADGVACALTAAGVGDVLPSARLRSASRRGRRAARQLDCHIVCEPLHLDAAAAPESVSLDVPHLPIAVGGHRAIVGPLVVPGLTGCLRCRDLHRADADAAWPRIAVQLQHAPPPALDTVLAQSVSAWAALQVVALIEGGPQAAPTLGVEWQFTLPGGHVTTRTRPAHPLCGCRWWAA